MSKFAKDAAPIIVFGGAFVAVQMFLNKPLETQISQQQMQLEKQLTQQQTQLEKQLTQQQTQLEKQLTQLQTQLERQTAQQQTQLQTLLNKIDRVPELSGSVKQLQTDVNALLRQEIEK